MKKLILTAVVMIALALILSPKAKAAEDTADETIPYREQLGELRDSLSDEVREKLDSIGLGDIASADDISLDGFFAQLTDELKESVAAPLSSCALTLFVIILSSLLEGYTFSLRYTETREVMSVVSSLLIAGVVVSPLTSLINSAAQVISAASTLMLGYFPITVGMMFFSGRVIKAGSYYSTVMIASQLISQLSARFIVPMLSAYTGLAVSSGMSARIRLRGLCDMLYSFIKWSLSFIMAIYTAALSMQTLIASSADSLSARAVRFTLSSFIPLVGSSISEAYNTVRAGVDALRSGAGVFAIAAVIIAFLPVIVRAVLWRFALSFARYSSQALGTDTCGEILSSMSDVLGAVIAVSVTIMAVFIISTAAVMNVGGAS